MEKRGAQILELLSRHGKIRVAKLAKQLGVSQVTIRKDLDDMGRKGVIRREHGYAIFGGSDDVANRLAFHYEEKRRIATKAAGLVSAGETVMIENGSCCTLLAEEIARTKPSTTIITNSAFIASYIRRVEGARVVLLGGDFQNDAQVMVGPILRVCVEQFRVNKLFVGADGYIPGIGFTANDHLRVQAVRDMAERAKKVIAVTESDKFFRDSVTPLAIHKGVAAVVTDQQISPEAEEILQKDGIKIYKAG
ncbi:MAG: DeoR/GlpR transcriptional regulator [Clostridiales bacterium]|nr:DeoR/GlpR transcriptional regulator [Clostridiales bacterium]